MKDITVTIHNAPDTFIPQQVIGCVIVPNNFKQQEHHIEEEDIELIDLPDLLKEQRELCAEIFRKVNIGTYQYKKRVNELILNAPSPLDTKTTEP